MQYKYATGSGDTPCKIETLINLMKWYIGFNLRTKLNSLGIMVSG